MLSKSPLSSPSRSLADLRASLPTPDPVPPGEVGEPADLIEPFAPLQYGPLPIIIAAALIGLVVLWFGWLHLAERLRRRTPRGPATAAPVRLDADQVRAQTLDRIGQIEQAGLSGSITARHAHQQLSEVVRDYVTTVSDVPASTMTLHDLRTANLEALAQAVELTYPPAFDAVGDGDLRRSAHTAREVVTRWN